MHEAKGGNFYMLQSASVKCRLQQKSSVFWMCGRLPRQNSDEKRLAWKTGTGLWSELWSKSQATKRNGI